MPDPIIAPIPSAVRDHGPNDFFSRCSGRSESLMSLSMDFLAKSWLAKRGSLKHGNRAATIGRPVKCVVLPLGLSADHLFHLALFGAASILAGLFGSLLLACSAFGFLAFFFAQCFGICHSPILK